jgi:hypothetical protein
MVNSVVKDIIQVIVKSVGIQAGGSNISLTRYWKQQTNFYELWKITGVGTMTGLKRGDPMTVTGTGLNAIYAVPDTAPYITRDTDYVFHKSDGSVSTLCDGNRLVGNDFPKIIVKYADASPYAIEYIGILDTGQIVNNKMRDDFHLSIWWSNTLSFHGNVKGNRPLAQQYVWTSEATAVAPTVTTTAISAILSTMATSGGNVTATGGATVTARGVCWGTSANPTVAGSYTTDSSGTGSYVSSITGLSALTTYHVRAYATNSAGTGYGADVQFTTLTAFADDSWLARWELDPITSGTLINDVSGNGNTLGLVDCVLTTDRGARANKALQFNGTSAYLYHITITIPNDVFALTGWFKADAWANFNFLFSDTNPAIGSGGYALMYVTSSNSLRFYVGHWSTVAAGSNHIDIPMTDTTGWHFWTAMYSKALGKMYFSIDNGTLYSADVNYTIVSGGGILVGKGTATEFFSGKKDQIYFRNRILTAGEITTDYNTVV